MLTIFYLVLSFVAIIVGFFIEMATLMSLAGYRYGGWKENLMLLFWCAVFLGTAYVMIYAAWYFVSTIVVFLLGFIL